MTQFLMQIILSWKVVIHPLEAGYPQNALHIAATRKQLDKYNELMLENIGQNISS